MRQTSQPVMRPRKNASTVFMGRNSRSHCLRVLFLLDTDLLPCHPDDISAFLYARNKCANSDKGWGDGYYCAASSACLHTRGSQKSVHRNSAARNVAQPLGEAQGRLSSTSEDIAQVPFRAASGYGNSRHGHSAEFRPAQHRV